MPAVAETMSMLKQQGYVIPADAQFQGKENQGLREGGSRGTSYPSPGSRGPEEFRFPRYVLVSLHNTVIKLANSKSTSQPIHYW